MELISGLIDKCGHMQIVWVLAAEDLRCLHKIFYLDLITDQSVDSSLDWWIV